MKGSFIGSDRTTWIWRRLHVLDGLELMGHIVLGELVLSKTSDDSQRKPDACPQISIGTSTTISNVTFALIARAASPLSSAAFCQPTRDIIKIFQENSTLGGLFES
jgi:hypothetical protein